MLAKARGLCRSHGALRFCQHESCEKQALARSLCWSHGAYGFCKHDGCKKPVRARGLCRPHLRSLMKKTSVKPIATKRKISNPQPKTSRRRVVSVDNSLLSYDRDFYDIEESSVPFSVGSSTPSSSESVAAKNLLSLAGV